MENQTGSGAEPAPEPGSVDESAEEKTLTLDEYLRAVESVTASGRVGLTFRVMEALRGAEAAGDAETLAALRTEVNVVYCFAGFASDDFDQVNTTGTRLFSSENLGYVERRAAETENLLARSWYLHAAWLAQPRRERAAAAVDSYLVAAKNFLTREPDGDALRGFRITARSAFGLASAAGKRDEVRDWLVKVVAGLPRQYGVARAEFIEELVADKKLPRKDLVGLKPLVIELMPALAANDPEILHRLSRLGKRIDAKLGEPADREWDHRLGEALRQSIAVRPEPLMKMLLAQQAAAAFQRARDEEAATEMRDLMRETSKQQELITIEEKIEGVDGWIAAVQRGLRKTFDEHGALGAIALMATGPQIVPNVAKIRAHIDEMSSEGIGIADEIVSSVEVGEDYRIVGRSEPGETNRRRSFLRDYEIRARFMASLAMHAFAIELVATGDVGVEDIMQYFARSCLGQPEEPIQGEVELLTLLRPSIRAWVQLFTEERAFDEQILVVDSIVPKFETALRKLARLHGIADTRQVDRGEGLVDEYVGLEILDNPRMKAVLGEDLLELVHFTLDREGEGLRDRVAHGAVKAGGYTRALSEVVLCMLRLAGVTVEKTQ